MTRKGMALAVVACLVWAFSVPVAAQGNPFQDVPRDHWAYDAISTLWQAGLVEGYPDGTFGGDRFFTRYEMAMVFARALARLERLVDERVAAQLGEVREGVRRAHEDIGTLRATLEGVRSRLTQDVAGNVATQVNAFAGGIPPGANSATSRNVQTFLVSAPAAAQNINNGRTGVGAPTCPSGTPTVRQLSAAVTGPSGFPNPWSVVHFYVIDNVDGGAVRWVAQATSPASVSDNGTNRTYTFTVNLDASNAFASALASRRSIAAQANLPVFAVGVDADGDALRTNNNTNLSVCNQS